MYLFDVPCTSFHTIVSSAHVKVYRGVSQIKKNYRMGKGLDLSRLRTTPIQPNHCAEVN